MLSLTCSVYHALGCRCRSGENVGRAAGGGRSASGGCAHRVDWQAAGWRLFDWDHHTPVRDERHFSFLNCVLLEFNGKKKVKQRSLFKVEHYFLNNNQSIDFCVHCFSKTMMYSNLTNSSVEICIRKRWYWLENCIYWWVCRALQPLIHLCLLYRSNSSRDRPVERVELHGQHGVRLQGGVRVIGRRPGLLTQLPTIKWSGHQALQDLLRFREDHKSGDCGTKAAELNLFNGGV